MWGGFDLASATKQLEALGSQLGEAIQKAKHEVETTIEGFEKGEDCAAPASVQSLQPTAEDIDGSRVSANCTTEDSTSTHQAEHSDACSISTAADAAVQLGPTTAVQPTTAPHGKAKRKVIKKIVKKVAPHEAALRTCDGVDAQQDTAVPKPQQTLAAQRQEHLQAPQQNPDNDLPSEQQVVQQQASGFPQLSNGSGNGLDVQPLDQPLQQREQIQQQCIDTAPQQQQQIQQQCIDNATLQHQNLQHSAEEQLASSVSEQQVVEDSVDSPLKAHVSEEPQLTELQDHKQQTQHTDVVQTVQKPHHDSISAQHVTPDDTSSGRQLQQVQPATAPAQEEQLVGSGQSPSCRDVGMGKHCTADILQQPGSPVLEGHNAGGDAEIINPSGGVEVRSINGVESTADKDPVHAALAHTCDDTAQEVTHQGVECQLQHQQHASELEPPLLAEVGQHQSAIVDSQPDAADAAGDGRWNQHSELLQQHDQKHSIQQQQQSQQQQTPGPAVCEGGGNAVLGQGQAMQQQLAAREDQLTRAAARLSELELTVAQLTESKAELDTVVRQLTEANEHLALRAAKVSEAELEEIQQEAAGRLAAAERKVFALTKERDALKRAVAAATASPAGGETRASEVAALKTQLQKKDELVEELMEEGQKLSKRQLELEASVKKVRQQLKAVEADRDKVSALLAAERAEVQGLRRAKGNAERDLLAAVESGRQELEAVRQQAQADLLNTQAEQAAANASAAQAATGELAAALKAAEARNAALTDSLTELQEALERQRAAADLREEMLRQDISDVERRAQAAELRHQELSSKLPEATAPLLRQISAIQDASAAQSQAWTAAERSLTARLREAEAAAAAAGASEAAAQEALGELQVRLAAAEAAAAAAKASGTEATNRASRAEERLALAQTQLEEHLQAATEAEVALVQLRGEMKTAEATASRKLDAERSVRQAMEQELSRARAELEALQASTSSLHGMPPAMAGPGLKWVLVSEAEEAAALGGPHVDLTRRISSFSSQLGASGRYASDMHAEDVAGFDPTGAGSTLVGGSNSQQGSDAAGLFDAGELLTGGQGVVGTPGCTPRAADTTSQAGYAGALGSPTGSMASSRQAQLRAVHARLASGGTVAEAAVQRMRAALRQKMGECASLEGRLKELEATRDQLASELVNATHSAEQAADAVKRVPQIQAEMQQLAERYAAAMELLGERDEQLEEMAADLIDMKQLYRQQIEALVGQLAAAGSAPAAHAQAVQ